MNLLRLINIEIHIKQGQGIIKSTNIHKINNIQIGVFIQD